MGDPEGKELLSPHYFFKALDLKRKGKKKELQSYWRSTKVDFGRNSFQSH